MCACVHVCNMYVYVREQVCMSVCMCMHTCECVCMSGSVYVCASVCTCMYMCECMHVQGSIIQSHGTSVP